MRCNYSFLCFLIKLLQPYGTRFRAQGLTVPHQHKSRTWVQGLHIFACLRDIFAMAYPVINRIPSNLNTQFVAMIQTFLLAQKLLTEKMSKRLYDGQKF